MAGLSWLRPELLWGLLAVALPLLIHLIGRRKRRTVGFATLRFLERAAARASARWRLKRLLLLLARMLAIAALVALFAGPGWQSAEEEGAPQLSVLVIDTSFSMSAKVEGTTPFERAKESLLELIEDGSSADRFVILTSAARPLAGSSEISGRGEALLDVAEASRRIAALKVSADDSGLVRAIENGNAAVAAASLGGELGSARLVVVTDMQRHAWRELDGLRESDTPVTLISVGDGVGPNSWIEKIVQRDGGFEVTLGGLGLSKEAAKDNGNLQSGASDNRKVVFTYTAEDGEQQSLTAFVDGDRTVFTPSLGAVADSGDAQVGKAAVTTVKVELVPGGALSYDDTLELSANPSGPVDVLLVNGDPRGFEIRDELLFMRRALGSDGKLSKRFAIKEVRQTELPKVKLEQFEVVWLANPAALSSEVALTLAARVEEGMGLVVSAGDNWHPERSGDFLMTLLASPLRDRMTLAGDDSTRPPFESPDAASLLGPLSGFGDEEGRLGELLSAVRVTGYWLADVGLEEQTSVVARLSNNAALLVERNAGEGRYLLFTTSVDRDWSDLCLSPVFLPFLERVITHAAGRTRSGLPSYLMAGARVVSPFTDTTQVEGPDGALQNWTPGRSDISLERTGVYRVASADVSPKTLGGFVVRVDPAESELVRYSVDELAKLGSDGVLSLDADGGRGSLGRRDLSKWAAMMLLFALAAEALLSARWPGRKHARLEPDNVG